MANATVVRNLKDVVTTKRVRDGVVLTLSNEEAIALRSLTGKVSGPQDCSPRFYTENIYKALSLAEVPHQHGVFEGGVRCYSNNIDLIVDAARDLEEK